MINTIFKLNIMKNPFLCIFCFFVMWSLKSQMTPVKTFRIENASTSFGFNISKGSKVVDLDGEQVYLAINPIAGTSTIDGSLANLLPIGGRGYGVVGVADADTDLPSTILTGGRVLDEATNEIYIAIADVPSQAGNTLTSQSDNFELVSSRFKVVPVANRTTDFGTVEKGNRVIDEATGLLYIAGQNFNTGGNLDAQSTDFGADPITSKIYVDLRHDIIQVTDVDTDLPADVLAGNRVLDQATGELYIATADVTSGSGVTLNDNSASFELVSSKYRTNTEIFEEGGGASATDHVLSKTPIPDFDGANFKVTFNGIPLDESKFVYNSTANTITIDASIPTAQYDEVSVTYLSIE